MRQRFQYFLLFVFLFVGFFAFAQPKKVVNVKQDSLKSDSSHFTESILIRQQQQQQQSHLDSLLKLQIQQELKGVVGNQAKTEELQAKLVAIDRADSVRKLQQKRKIDELKKNNKAFPVILLSDTLFNVFVRVGSFKC